MASTLHDPKKLTDWLQLDYFRRPRPLARSLRWLVGLAVLLSGAAVAWSVWPTNHAWHQAGPVSTAHTFIGSDCARCHTTAFEPLRRFVAGDPHRFSVADATCLGCHDGPQHQPTVQADGCVACHQEHRGHAALARIPDDHCVACHADLKRHAPGTDLRDVRVFAPGEANHPGFRWWDGKKDPGTVRFNHAAHLKPGGVPTVNAQQLDLQTKGYGAGAAGPPRPPAVKQLDCASCHQPDAAGRYMKPVNFDHHCKECHPLLVRPSGLKDKGLEREALAFFAAPAPHVEPALVRTALVQRFTAFARADWQELGLPKPGSEDAPRFPPTGSRTTPLVPEKLWAWATDQADRAELVLFDGAGGCRFCHSGPPRDASRRTLPVFPKSQVNSRVFPKIGESPRWLPRGGFHHERHRMLTCTECHAAPTSAKASDVLLPGIASCLACHNRDAPGDSARGDCVECHQFHGRPGQHGWKLVRRPAWVPRLAIP
jgi:hypothetical protein